ncbi:transposase [Streptomyces zagrosensis]|uniref:Transposase n=1 Tax=Streptomyces zagrosensis TaxID=1042984 RepID=A0A7W9Q5M8_9ACTN|nr:transposase [Streptomyces zagrosensis]
MALRGRLAAARGAWLVFEDEAGFSMTPPQAKTWSQRGRTPVVRVRGRSRRRISIAALTCYKPGHCSRIIYRPRRDDGRRDGRKSFLWRDYRDLLIAAHQQLGGPIVLIWDNLNVHKSAGLREFAASRDWRTIYYLPPYAPDLNPVEGIWSLLRRGWLSNVAFSTPEHLIQRIRHGLRHIRARLLVGHVPISPTPQFPGAQTLPAATSAAAFFADSHRAHEHLVLRLTGEHAPHPCAPRRSTQTPQENRRSRACST